MIKNLPKEKILVTSKFKTLQKITPILSNCQEIRAKIIFLLTRPAQSQELIKITQKTTDQHFSHRFKHSPQNISKCNTAASERHRQVTPKKSEVTTLVEKERITKRMWWLPPVIPALGK